MTNIDLNTLPLNDAKTFELLSVGDTEGVFGLKEAGMRTFIQKVAPEKFEHLIAFIALFRPYLLEKGLADEYIDRKHGRKIVGYAHPLLELILKGTYGLTLYQEQIMEIASALAGFSPDQANLLRKDLGKKVFQDVAKQREMFTSGARANGINEKLADEIFEQQLLYFGGYAFRRAYAASHALKCYLSAYLKANYPEVFMAGSPKV